jgi:chromosome partitioning protein
MIHHTYHTFSVHLPMNYIIAICNQKGGVGKTSLTINLGAALSAQNRKVLLIDLDPQGHLTEGVGVRDLYLKEDNTLFEALTDHKGEADKLVHHVPHENFDIIASNYQMVLIEQKLFMTRNREHKLRELLDDLTKQYDFVLIDCPPNLGNLTDNALNAARRVVVPIQAETSSVRALDLLFDQIESVEHGLKITVAVLAVVPNLVQDSALSKRILSDLRENISVVTPFEIKKRVVLQEAYDKGRSIFSYEPPNSAKANDASELKKVYADLASIVIDQLSKT